MPEYKRPDYANNPRLAACARKLDASLWPIIDQVLADNNLTRADLPRLRAEREARERAALTKEDDDA
jgi:hypothetical protein